MPYDCTYTYSYGIHNVYNPTCEEHALSPEHQAHATHARTLVIMRPKLAHELHTHARGFALRVGNRTWCVSEDAFL